MTTLYKTVNDKNLFDGSCLSLKEIGSLLDYDAAGDYTLAEYAQLVAKGIVVFTDYPDDSKEIASFFLEHLDTALKNVYRHSGSDDPELWEKAVKSARSILQDAYTSIMFQDTVDLVIYHVEPLYDAQGDLKVIRLSMGYNRSMIFEGDSILFTFKEDGKEVTLWVDCWAGEALYSYLEELYKYPSF